MPAMIQIRNVPDDLHRKLKLRAARAGQSLSDFLLGQIREVAARATQEELLERLRKLPPVTPSTTRSISSGRIATATDPVTVLP